MTAPAKNKFLSGKCQLPRPCVLVLLEGMSNFQMHLIGRLLVIICLFGPERMSTAESDGKLLKMSTPG